MYALRTPQAAPKQPRATLYRQLICICQEGHSNPKKKIPEEPYM